jgi:ABC-type lipoprotein export system ATPase subunit
VTHDAELASLADSRLVLRDGRPVQQNDSPRAVPAAGAEAAR